MSGTKQVKHRGAADVEEFVSRGQLVFTYARRCSPPPLLLLLFYYHRHRAYVMMAGDGGTCALRGCYRRVPIGRLVEDVGCPFSTARRTGSAGLTECRTGTRSLIGRPVATGVLARRDFLAGHLNYSDVYEGIPRLAVSRRICRWPRVVAVVVVVGFRSCVCVACHDQIGPGHPKVEKTRGK